MTGLVKNDRQEEIINILLERRGRMWLEGFLQAADDACAMSNAQYWFDYSAKRSDIIMYIRFVNVPVKDTETGKVVLRVPDLIYVCPIKHPYIHAEYGTASILSPGSMRNTSPHPHMYRSEILRCGICFGNENLNVYNTIDDPSMIGMFIMRMHAHACSYSRATGPYRSYSEHKGSSGSVIIPSRPVNMLANHQLDVSRILAELATCSNNGIRMRAKKVADLLGNSLNTVNSFVEMMTFIVNEIAYDGFDIVRMSLPLENQTSISAISENIQNATGISDVSATNLSFIAAVGTCCVYNEVYYPIWNYPLEIGGNFESSGLTTSSVDAKGETIIARTVPYSDDYGDNLENIIETRTRNEQKETRKRFSEISKVWSVQYSSLAGIERETQNVLFGNYRKIAIKQLALDCIEASGGSVPALVRETPVGGMVGSFIMEACDSRTGSVGNFVRKLVECGKRLEKYQHLSRPNVAFFYRTAQDQWDFFHNWTDASVDRFFPEADAVPVRGDIGDA